MKNPLLIVALASLVLVSGCGRDEARVTMNTNDAKMTVAGGNASVALPDDFPKDVSIMPGGSVKGVMKSSEVTTITMVASATPQETAKYYQDNLGTQGWKIENTIAAGKVTMFTALKDKRELSFQIGDNDGKNAAVMIMMRQKN